MLRLFAASQSSRGIDSSFQNPASRPRIRFAAASPQSRRRRHILSQAQALFRHPNRKPRRADISPKAAASTAESMSYTTIGRNVCRPGTLPARFSSGCVAYGFSLVYIALDGVIMKPTHRTHPGKQLRHCQCCFLFFVLLPPAS